MATLEEIEKELEEIPLTEHEWDIVEWLITEVARLRELVDSVTEVVEIFHPKSQAQEAWRREWLDKARTGRE